MYRYDYTPEEIEELSKSFSSNHYINFTITFDPKRVSLTQAWLVAKNPHALMKSLYVNSFMNSLFSYRIVCETHKNGFPHFHGQFVLPKPSHSGYPVLEQIRFQNIIAKHLRSEYGRAQVLFDDGLQREDCRTYSEYIMKDVLTNQTIYKTEYPALHVYNM